MAGAEISSKVLENQQKELFVIAVLASLENEIRLSQSPIEKLRLEAKLSSYMARLGRRPEALALVSDVRSNPIGRGDAEATAWICLTEGIVEFHTNPGDGVFDRFRRSHLISRTIRGTEVAGLSGAWLAHMEFSFGSFKKFCELAGEVLDAASADHHSVLCRIAISVGDAYIYAGDDASSKIWYARARFFASTERDTLSMATIAHNVVTVVVRRQRMATLSGGTVPPMTALVPTMLESSQNLDRAVGMSFVDQYEVYLRIQYFIVNGKFSDALSIIDEIKDGWERRVPARMYLQTLMDELLCRAHVHSVYDTAAIENILSDSRVSELDPDDRALLNWTSAEITRTKGDSQRSNKYSQAAEREYADHCRVANELLENLADHRLSPMERTDLYGK